ncbi:cold shock domain protein 1 [Prunus dulcis]|uniref:Cold shock domain protein 1 n=1 Tax=Prunus dulcis TaxID=3755 RepID=A0A4Y1RMP0_PRUDU|nr:cold shock domain protein 1 [Prunus dulcis]
MKIGRVSSVVEFFRHRNFSTHPHAAGVCGGAWARLVKLQFNPMRSLGNWGQQGQGIIGQNHNQVGVSSSAAGSSSSRAPSSSRGRSCRQSRGQSGRSTTQARVFSMTQQEATPDVITVVAPGSVQVVYEARTVD